MFSAIFFQILARKIWTVKLIILLTSRVAIVSPTDPVCVATQKMRDFRVKSVVVATGNTLQGIFT
jgi:CBS domain-containing protein